MGKAIQYGFISVIMLFSTVLYAAPVDIPMGAKALKKDNMDIKLGGEWGSLEKWNFAVSSTTDFINKRDLEDLGSGYDLHLYYLNLIFSINNNVNIYPMIGTYDIDEEFTITGEETDYFYGIGCNAFVEIPDFFCNFFCDLKYRIIDNLYETSKTTWLYKIGSTIDYEERQVALGISAPIKLFTPYLGIKYSDVKYESETSLSIWGTSSSDKLSANSDKVVGGFVGCSFEPTESISLDIQGRFIEETAFSANILYKF